MERRDKGIDNLESASAGSSCKPIQGGVVYGLVESGKSITLALSPTLALSTVFPAILYLTGNICLAEELIGATAESTGKSEPSGITNLVITTRYSPVGEPFSPDLFASSYLPAWSVRPLAPVPCVEPVGTKTTVAPESGLPSRVTVPATGANFGRSEAFLPQPTTATISPNHVI